MTAHSEPNAPGGYAQIVVRALHSPSNVAQVLRAQLALRACNRAPWTVRLRGSVAVENHGSIELGERVRLDGRTVRIELVANGGRISIGDGSFVNYGASISSHASVTIGSNVLIGNYALIMDSDYHDVHDHSLPGVSAPIVIEDDAWIGTRAMILKGVRIGRGAVVAAGAIVTSDVAPRTLVAGPTARVVREL